MDLTCSNCGAPIEAAQVNVKTDIAKCTACETIHRVSALMQTELPATAGTGLALSGGGGLARRGPSALSKPAGSEVDGEIIEGEGSVTISPPGIGAGSLFQAFFAVFWLGFIAFWTAGALQASVFFAAFSIPFWLVGFAMLKGLVDALVERQVLRFEPYQMVVERNGLFFKRAVIVDYEHISYVGRGSVKVQNPAKAMRFIGNANAHSRRGGIQAPLIRHGVEETTFAETLSSVEQDWLIATVEDAALRASKRR